MTKTASETPREPFLQRLAQSVKSIGKIALKSRKSRLTHTDGTKPLIILGNGPSLKETIDVHGETLRQTDSMAVNFAACTHEFKDIKPKYYILADPHFFDNRNDPNVRRLNDNLRQTDWEMTLLLPFGAKTPVELNDNHNIKIERYNALGAEGFRWLTDMAYRYGLAMPRPRNVMIPAIMTAITMGYKEIYITGADHSWTKTLSVDENNNVISIQPHFYKDNEQELERIRKEYLKYPLHTILDSFRLAFKSYHAIQDFAIRHGITIYNSTPDSFIDAFTRRQLPSISDSRKHNPGSLSGNKPRPINT